MNDSAYRTPGDDKTTGVDVVSDVYVDGGPSNNRIGDVVTVNEERDLVRGLHQRHISLIALAGAIVREIRPNQFYSTAAISTSKITTDLIISYRVLDSSLA